MRKKSHYYSGPSSFKYIVDQIYEDLDGQVSKKFINMVINNFTAYFRERIRARKNTNLKDFFNIRYTEKLRADDLKREKERKKRAVETRRERQRIHAKHYAAKNAYVKECKKLIANGHKPRTAKAWMKYYNRYFPVDLLKNHEKFY